MSGVHFVANRSGVRSLANGAEMHRLANDAMDAAKGAAESLSPRVTGRYADSFAVEKDQTVTIAGEPRAAARLVNNAPYAAAVEYGYSGDSAATTSSAHRVLARTLQALRGS